MRNAILHLFWECPKSVEIWKNVSMWINNKLKININTTLNKETIILGYLLNNEFYYPFNTILITTKSYIFWCCRHSVPLNIFNLQSRIIFFYEEDNQDIFDLMNKML